MGLGVVPPALGVTARGEGLGLGVASHLQLPLVEAAPRAPPPLEGGDAGQAGQVEQGRVLVG